MRHIRSLIILWLCALIFMHRLKKNYRRRWCRSSWDVHETCTHIPAENQACTFKKIFQPLIMLDSNFQISHSDIALNYVESAERVSPHLASDFRMICWSLKLVIFYIKKGRYRQQATRLLIITKILMGIRTRIFIMYIANFELQFFN